MNQANHQQTLRNSFLAMHVVFSLVIFILSVKTVLHALGFDGGGVLNLPLAIFAGAEAVAAVLFLVPFTHRVAGLSLVIIFIIAFVVHALHGEWPLQLLVYIVVALFVSSHGPVSVSRASPEQGS